MSSNNRVWRLRSRPVGSIADTDLELCNEQVPVPAEGQVLVRTEFVSIDPTHRIWMSDKPQYMPKVEIGDIMRAVSMGVVEVSHNPQFPVGTRVIGFGGVCDYYIGIAGVNLLYKAGGFGLPEIADLSVCSIIIGLTAWHGVEKVLRITKDDVLVVSAAAGAVGSLVGQLAKLKGARVIGIAGSAEKCAWLRDELKFDHAVNYKTENVRAAIQAFAPEGITSYFDNVGGSVTDDVLACARNNARVAVCGSISEYDDNWTGQKNWNLILMRRMTVQGYICTDHFDELEQVRREIGALVAAGKVKYAEDVRSGLENYPATVRLLLSGQNTGKLLLKL